MLVTRFIGEVFFVFLLSNLVSSPKEIALRHTKEKWKADLKKNTIVLQRLQLVWKRGTSKLAIHVTKIKAFKNVTALDVFKVKHLMQINHLMYLRSCLSTQFLCKRSELLQKHVWAQTVLQSTEASLAPLRQPYTWWNHLLVTFEQHYHISSG